MSIARTPAWNRIPTRHRHVADPSDLASGPLTDPARISPIADRYQKRIRKQCRALRGAIRQGVVEHDVFELKGQAISAPRSFPFTTDPGRISSFEDWLDTQFNRGLVEEVGHESYIRASYKRGVDHADHALTRSGIIAEPELVEDLFNAPVHTEQLEIALTRTFDNVESVRTSTRSQVGRELADGLAQGENPRTIAGRLNDRIDHVTRYRLEVMARTETAYAQSEATLSRFDQHGVEDVTVIAEWTTAGDDRVCDICIGLEGETFKLDDARGMMPRHPNCRCAWAPVSKP